MTHAWTPELRAEFESLEATQGPDFDVWLLLDSESVGGNAIADEQVRCHPFDDATLSRLHYPRLSERRLVQHPHFPVLDFFLRHQQYDHYWLIEYDVRYTGAWEALLRSFGDSDHDLITTHIRRFAQEPHYYWWNSLQHPTKSIPRPQYLRSLNVIYRISSRALAYLHRSQLDGWAGFPEVLIPTLLHDAGFTLLDMGGDGEFVLEEDRNRLYTSDSLSSGTLGLFGTVRWRPSRTRAGPRRNTIYHPVKPRSMMESRAFRARNLLLWFVDAARHVVRACVNKGPPGSASAGNPS